MNNFPDCNALAYSAEIENALDSGHELKESLGNLKVDLEDLKEYLDNLDDF